MARTQLAASPQRLRGWAAPLRLRRRLRAAPGPPGQAEVRRRVRDASSHGRSGARPGKRPGPRTPRRPGAAAAAVRVGAPQAWSGPAALPPASAQAGACRVPAARSAPPPRVWRPGRAFGSTERAAQTAGWAAGRGGAAPTWGDRPCFLAALQMTGLALKRAGRVSRLPPHPRPLSGRRHAGTTVAQPHALQTARV